MRAVVCKQWGPPSALVVEDLPALSPNAGEVLVAVKAAGVNFPDVLIVQDKYQFKPPLPFTPGSELAGTVAAVGAGVTRFTVGDPVVASVPWGAFAEQVIVLEDNLMSLPPDVDLDVAAAFTLAYGTSHHALVDRAALRPGETLLVLGAAGGVGLSAIEIGEVLGARVIAAASSPEKLAACREHGADEIIDYSREDLRDRIKALTFGRGADVIYDPVGGPFSEPAFRGIAWRGRHLVVGFAAGDIPRLPWNLMLLKGASVVGVFWGDWARREPDAYRRSIVELMGWLREGKLRPQISARYPLEQVPAALEAMMQRKVIGKIVITP